MDTARETRGRTAAAFFVAATLGATNAQNGHEQATGLAATEPMRSREFKSETVYVAPAPREAFFHTSNRLLAAFVNVSAVANSLTSPITTARHILLGSDGQDDRKRVAGIQIVTNRTEQLMKVPGFDRILRAFHADTTPGRHGPYGRVGSLQKITEANKHNYIGADDFHLNEDFNRAVFSIGGTLGDATPNADPRSINQLANTAFAVLEKSDAALAQTIAGASLEDMRKVLPDDIASRISGLFDLMNIPIERRQNIERDALAVSLMMYAASHEREFANIRQALSGTSPISVRRDANWTLTNDARDHDLVDIMGKMVAIGMSNKGYLVTGNAVPEKKANQLFCVNFLRFGTPPTGIPTLAFGPRRRPAAAQPDFANTPPHDQEPDGTHTPTGDAGARADQQDAGTAEEGARDERGTPVDNTAGTDARPTGESQATPGETQAEPDEQLRSEFAAAASRLGYTVPDDGNGEAWGRNTALEEQFLELLALLRISPQRRSIMLQFTTPDARHIVVALDKFGYILARNPNAPDGTPLRTGTTLELGLMIRSMRRVLVFATAEGERRDFDEATDNDQALRSQLMSVEGADQVIVAMNDADTGRKFVYRSAV